MTTAPIQGTNDVNSESVKVLSPGDVSKAYTWCIILIRAMKGNGKTNDILNSGMRNISNEGLFIKQGRP